MLEDIALALGALSLIVGGLLYFTKYTKTKKDDRLLGKVKDALDWARNLLSGRKEPEEKKDGGDDSAK